MTTFIGDYPCKADSKGRIMIPMAFKKQMDTAARDKFVVKKDIYEKCLVLYPMDEWDRQIKILRSKLNPYNKEHNRFLREFSKGMVEAALDSSNRILIPKRLLESAEIEKDVMLAGQDGKIEIWNSALYDRIREDDTEFEKLAEKIMGGGFNLEEGV
ncbi:MAG: division/cell wall cluster transcriptional repressor MraZ [Bacteroidota bacterium]